MAALPDHVGDHPMLLALLEAFNRQPGYLCPSKTASQQNRNYGLIGLTGGNVVKAYPAAILAQHGVVLDDLPIGPIAVTW